MCVCALAGWSWRKPEGEAEKRRKHVPPPPLLLPPHLAPPHSPRALRRRYHNYALRGVAFHRTYPLFASSSDDATVHVFHGTVYADLMSNPLIVPVKVLRGHDIVDYSGVLDVAFHPTQPWVFSAGADSNICLFCN